MREAFDARARSFETQAPDWRQVVTAIPLSGSFSGSGSATAALTTEIALGGLLPISAGLEGDLTVTPEEGLAATVFGASALEGALDTQIALGGGATLEATIRAMLFFPPPPERAFKIAGGTRELKVGATPRKFKMIRRNRS